MGYYHKTRVSHEVADQVAREKRAYDQLLAGELEGLRELFLQAFEEFSSRGRVVYAGRNALLEFGSPGYVALSRQHKEGTIPEAAFQFGKKFAVVHGGKVIAAMLVYGEDLYTAEV